MLVQLVVAIAAAVCSSGEPGEFLLLPCEFGAHVRDINCADNAVPTPPIDDPALLLTRRVGHPSPLAGDAALQ